MIAVTGATGFIGSHLVAELIRRKTQVVALYRSVQSQQRTISILEHNNISSEQTSRFLIWRKADILDFFSLVETFKDITAIYHCAGFVSFNQKDKTKLFNINVKGTANVVDAALENNVKKICHVSSISALGEPEGNELIDETCPWEKSDTPSNYSKSKHLAENEIWRGGAEGLKVAVASPSVVLGETVDFSGNGSFFKVIKNGLKYYTQGSTGFVDIKDVIKALIILMEGEFHEEKYIISSENISFKDLFTTIAKLINKNTPNKKADNFSLKLAMLLSQAGSFFTRKPAVLTKEVVRNSTSICLYNNQKSVEKLGLQYTPIKETLKRLSEHYKKLS